MKAVLDGLSLGLADRDSSVRFQAITGMAEAGKDARSALEIGTSRESDPTNQAVLVETLGTLKDSVSLPLFIEILGDPGAETVRMAALVALAQFRDPQSLRARFSLVYPKRRRRRSSRVRCPTWPAWVSSAQRSRLVHGERRPRNPGIRAFELERQESAARRSRAIGAGPHRRPG